MSEFLENKNDINEEQDDYYALPVESKQERVINKYLTHKPLGYGKRFYLKEFIAERVIQIIAFLSIGFIIAIFYYVFQEATFAFKEPNESKSETSLTAKNDSLKNDSLKSSDSAAEDENLKPETYGSEESTSTKKDKMLADNNDNELQAEQYKPESYSPDGSTENMAVNSNENPDELKPETYSIDGENTQVPVPENRSDESVRQEESFEKSSDSTANVTSNASTDNNDNLAKSPSESIGAEESLTLKKLFFPNDFIDNKPEYIWQPISSTPKYSFIPLFIGALKVTLIGLLIAAPIAILAAIFTVAFAPRWLREIIKPAIEILAGFPSVVIGFFCLITLATLFQDIFDTTYRLNSFVGGMGMAFAVIPIIYTITEDALSAVPKFMKEASLALGASRWQTAYRVILPAATPGVFAALILGFGRAFGETMIALMATGNAALTSSDIFESVRTMAATIGAEMAEVEFRSTHYGVLFLIGAILFVITFTLNAVAEFYVRKKLMKKFQGL